MAYRSAWLLVPVAALTAAAAAYGLRRIAGETEPAPQVLWSAFVGRSATGWLFACLVITAAPDLPLGQTAVLVGCGVALFGAGCGIIRPTSTPPRT